MMERPSRKPNRLVGFDYRTPGAYYITVCTSGRKKIFWKPDNTLTEWGHIVRETILEIPNCYPGISVDHYVIMPNHIHLLLQINTDADGQPVTVPTVSTVIQQMKGKISKRVGFSVWQKGFYDHVVRDDADYRGIWNYIENNPAKWVEDELFDG